MIFSLAIYSAPYSSQASTSALSFAHALIKENHTLYRVFFYHDAIHNASSLNTPPQDDINLTNEWQSLARSHNVELIVCIAASLKRGVLNPTEATRYNKSTSNLAEHFELGGLGQLVDAAAQSDRLITFGA
jgi:tRNA 2-thiouridine synthesizing protein D